MNGILKAMASVFDMFWSRRGLSQFGGRPTTSREVVTEETALNFSAVWCATRLLCGTGAYLPLPVYRGLADENRQRDRKHPLQKLLNGSPNPEMTAYNFRSIMWQWQVNWGNAYAEIVREGTAYDAPVVALYPIHPAYVVPCRDESGLYYQVRNAVTREMEDVDASRIFHVPSIITVDGIVGHGVIEHARETIGAGIAAEKYGANWFGGAGVPRVVIEHPGKWDEPARDAFRKEWDEIHGGADGKRVALLQGGAKATPLSMSAEDSQFLETRQFGVEEIARWYGIPPHLLQHLLRATFNNIEHLGINFVQYSLIQWLHSWESAIWKQLLNDSEQADYFVEHNVDGLLRGDFASRMAGYAAAINVGLATRNQCRQKENWPAVPGGDTFLVQGAMVPLDEDGKPESKFTDVGSPPAPQPAAAEPDDDDTAAEESVKITAITMGVERIIGHDLDRFLAKEAKAITTFASKPGEFVQLVDVFYADLTPFVTSELADDFATYTLCGGDADAGSFALKWTDAGKAAVLDAAGKATPSELPSVIQAVIESPAWTERPVRALEGVKNAVSGV